MVKKAFEQCCLEEVSIVFGWCNLIVSFILLGFWTIIPFCARYREENRFLDFLYHIHGALVNDFSFGLFVTAAVSVSLLWGINTNRRLFMVPWLVFMGFMYASWTGLSLATFIIHPFLKSVDEIIIILSYTVAGCLLVYFWYIVYSLYQKMAAEEAIYTERDALVKDVEIV